jgi:hypothetical protein
MFMAKTLVFISHITYEKEVAIAFKELIKESFLGMIEVFISSDGESINMGQKWLESITIALKKCSIEIVLCSPQSVQRPWINFEAGAGWIRDIPVIPLCHSGMEPSKLPVPLNLLQAASATKVSDLNSIIPVLALAINSNTPTIDFTDFISKVTDFENRYTYWNFCNKAFAELRNFHPDLIPHLSSGKRIRLDLKEIQIKEFQEFVTFLGQHDILHFEQEEESSFTINGVFYKCSFTPLSKFAEILSDPNFCM